MISGVTSTNDQAMAQTIAQASHRTGADFSFLLSTAMRESSLNPEAKARTSSATGLFQFIEQTWLAMVARHGDKHGLGPYAEAIEQTPRGRYVVADRAMRQEILALRTDPRVAALMAGELAEENRAMLEAGLGRPARAGELYAAHFLGPQGALTLARASEARPGERADALFPEAAAANRSIFYGKGGRALSVAEVHARITRLPEMPQTLMAAGDTAPALRGADDPFARPDFTDSALALAGLGPEEVRFAAAPAPALAGAAALMPALRLTPQVIDILAALDPVPERSWAET